MCIFQDVAEVVVDSPSNGRLLLSPHGCFEPQTGTDYMYGTLLKV